jgi:type VI protein secretion system component VasK
MFARFLNTRIPSLILMLAFAGCCLMFCKELMGARDSAQLTSSLVHRLILWGTLSLIFMLAFCLCLARITRYRKSLSEKRTAAS